MSFLPIWADFSGQSCKRIRSSQSKSHGTFNNNKCTVPKQFDLKFYPRSLKLEDPPKVTRNANCTLYKGIIKSQNHLSREYKSIAS